MHRFKILSCVVIFLLFNLQSVVTPCCGADSDEYIDISAYTKTTQYRVKFIHDTHNEMAGIDECHGCHHLYEDGILVEAESSEDTPCSDCHLPKMFDRGVTLTTAFHKKCKGCHLNKLKGPVMCGECHRKN